MTTCTTYDLFCDRCNQHRMQGARGHIRFGESIPPERQFGWRRRLQGWAICCDECVADLELAAAPLFAGKGVA